MLKKNPLESGTTKLSVKQRTELYRNLNNFYYRGYVKPITKSQIHKCIELLDPSRIFGWYHCWINAYHYAMHIYCNDVQDTVFYGHHKVLVCSKTKLPAFINEEAYELEGLHVVDNGLKKSLQSQNFPNWFQDEIPSYLRHQGFTRKQEIFIYTHNGRRKVSTEAKMDAEGTWFGPYKDLQEPPSTLNQTG